MHIMLKRKRDGGEAGYGIHIYMRNKPVVTGATVKLFEEGIGEIIYLFLNRDFVRQRQS